MKYIKSYDVEQPKFKKGDIVCYDRYINIFTIKDVNVTSEIFDDEEVLDFDDTYIYRICDNDDECFNWDWIDEFELRLATPEDIEKDKINKDIKKYNL